MQPFFLGISRKLLGRFRINRRHVYDQRAGFCTCRSTMFAKDCQSHDLCRIQAGDNKIRFRRCSGHDRGHARLAESVCGSASLMLHLSGNVTAWQQTRERRLIRGVLGDEPPTFKTSRGRVEPERLLRF